MKKLLFVLFACCCLTAAFSQKYYVVSMKGKVYANGKLLKKKDKITAETFLKFGSNEAMAYVISPGKGYYILSLNAVKPNSKDEFTAYVKNALMPPKQYFMTGTKASIPKELKFWNLKEVGAFFSDDVLLLQTATFGVNNQNIPLDDQHYFTLQYKNEKGDTVTKKLNQDFQQFSFSAADFPASKKPTTFAIALLYHDESTPITTEAGRFNLSVVPEKELCKELKSLKKEVPGESDESFYVNHARRYLDIIYGKHDPSEIKNLIARL